MAFDYRFFGGSGGEPRNLVMPSLQVQDWQSAFTYAVTSGYKKVILHGSSMGGGHVIVAGRSLENETALVGIISQVRCTQQRVVTVNATPSPTGRRQPQRTQHQRQHPRSLSLSLTSLSLTSRESLSR
jgi:hypothetical protein